MVSRYWFIAIGCLTTPLVAAPAHADPTLLWSTYYGGTSTELKWDVTFDSEDALLSVGTTGSSASIAGNIAGNFTHDGSLASQDDGFVTKFDNAGVRQWGTYYGGTGYDQMLSVAVDSSDNVITAGYTGSTNTASVISTVGDITLNGTYDGMLVKFTSTGSRSWGTYIGGNNSDYAFGVCVAPGGTIYVVGLSNSTDLSVGSVHQTTREGGDDAFLAKVSSAGAVSWITYFGGPGGVTSGRDCVVDANNNIYITGFTESSTSIAFNGPDSSLGGTRDAFVAKFTSAGALSKARYYGGPGSDHGYAIDLDSNNNIYIAGYTNSETEMDTDSRVLQDDEDAFVARFDTNFGRVWGRYYGGSATSAQNIDRFWDLEVSGQAVMLAGETDSFDLISTIDGFNPSFLGTLDGMFVALALSDGDEFYATYIGSTAENSPDLARGVAANFDQVAVCGSEAGIGGATVGAHDTTLSGSYDAFLLLIRMFSF